MHLTASAAVSCMRRSSAGQGAKLKIHARHHMWSALHSMLPPCRSALQLRQLRTQAQCHSSSQTLKLQRLPLQSLLQHKTPPSLAASARQHPSLSLPEQPPSQRWPVSPSHSSSSSVIPGKQALPRAAPSQQLRPTANSRLLCLGPRCCPQNCLPQSHRRPKRRPQAARLQKPPAQAAAL